MDPITDPVAVWDQATLTFYGHEAPAYVAKSKAGASRWLADFMQALPTGARILELGCGSGRDAEALLAHGFDVDATDGTPAMAAEAEQRLGRPYASCGSMSFRPSMPTTASGLVPTCFTCRAQRDTCPCVAGVEAGRFALCQLQNWEVGRT